MNTQVKHTPGPWEVNKSDKCLIMVSKEISPRVTQPIADVQYNKERYANAHLIAAAPAMYEALSRLRNVASTASNHMRLSGNEEEALLFDNDQRVVEAALAQAEGKG